MVSEVVEVVVGSSLVEVEVVVGSSVVEVLVVIGAAVLDDGGVVDVAAGGGMTLKLMVAPQSAREVPSGQQPASVQ